MYFFSLQKTVKYLAVLPLTALGMLTIGLAVYYLPAPAAQQSVFAPQKLETQLVVHDDAAGDDDAFYEDMNQEILTELIPFEEPADYSKPNSKAHILIYQTHSEEAYTMTADAEYVEAAKWRTADNLNNINRIGDALTVQLAEVYGYSVVHDTTNYERPKLATAYNRSLAGIQKNTAAHPELNVFIDVHRDAWNKNNTPKAVEIDGKKVARVMLVIGKGTDFKQPPDWETNLAFAQKICDNLAQIHPDLSRGISVKEGRYNQHISSRSILIEVGHNENTLEEALNVIPYLAQAIDRALQEMGV